VERDVAAARAKARTAKTQRGRQTHLFGRGLVSERDLEVARRDAAQAEAGARAARAKLDAAEAEVRGLRATRSGKARDLGAKLAEARGKVAKAKAQLNAAEAKLAGAKRALARQDNLLVKAPRSGMLTHVRAGESAAFVKQGEPLAEVVPQGDRRAVELFVSGNDAPLIVPGQNVRLQFEGWPAIQFGGWPDAAIGTFQGRVAFVGAEATPAGRFRVVAVPTKEADWPDEDVLRQGNRVNGWVLLERVALGYELWRQLNGFPPDLPPEAAKASGVKKKKKLK
jgi:multidrug resistance efflux pump